MNRRLTKKIKEWIIHKLGGITEQEIPAKTRIQFRYENVTPQRLTFRHDYIVHGYDDMDIAERYEKQEALMKLATVLHQEGYVCYTISDIDDEYFPRLCTVHKSIQADIWVVKMP